MPAESMMVVLRSPVQGLSARPGLQSQTVPAASASAGEGDAVAVNCEDAAEADCPGAAGVTATGKWAGVSSAAEAEAVRPEEPQAATAMATISVRRIGFRIGAWAPQARPAVQRPGHNENGAGVRRRPPPSRLPDYGPGTWNPP